MSEARTFAVIGAVCFVTGLAVTAVLLWLLPTPGVARDIKAGTTTPAVRFAP